MVLVDECVDGDGFLDAACVRRKFACVLELQLLLLSLHLLGDYFIRAVLKTLVLALDFVGIIEAPLELRFLLHEIRILRRG